MRNPIGLKGGPSIINGALVLSPFGHIKPLDTPSPSPTLQVHSLIPITLKPPFSRFIVLELLPPLTKLRPVRWRRQDSQKGRKRKVVVSGDEDVSLIRVFGGQGNEEVQDLLGFWAAVAVVAQEDYEGGGEI